MYIICRYSNIFNNIYLHDILLFTRMLYAIVVFIYIKKMSKNNIYIKNVLAYINFYQIRILCMALPYDDDDDDDSLPTLLLLLFYYDCDYDYYMQGE